MNTETHQFQAEVRQLLDIVINALYSDREIFVRELVSNASDALEKLRLKQLTDSNIYQPDKPLEITVTTDKENKTITIADTGIGMTEADLGHRDLWWKTWEPSPTPAPKNSWRPSSRSRKAERT